MMRGIVLTLLAISGIAMPGCSERERHHGTVAIIGQTVRVPTGTIADQLCSRAFRTPASSTTTACSTPRWPWGRARLTFAAYDEPISVTSPARNPGLRVLPEKITTDQYGFAVRLEDEALKRAIDESSGRCGATARTSPDATLAASKGAPAPMPSIPTGSGNVLRFGTAASPNRSLSSMARARWSHRYRDRRACRAKNWTGGWRSSTWNSER